MDIQKIREDFPILSRTVYGKPLVYFDNGATTQYSFKYPLLIVMVLLSISLVLSICIEQLKKIIHYNSFTCLLVQKICK